MILEATGYRKATYYYWVKRFDEPNKDEEIESLMKEIRSSHKDYGYRRMTQELRNRGIHINMKKVQRLMNKLGLQVTSYTRKSRKYSSYKGTVGTVAKNRIHRRFYTSVCHQKITTDTTEFKYFVKSLTGSVHIKKLYLDPFMDMFNGEILSYRVTEKPTAKAINEALEEAIQITSDCPYRRTFHSDQGWAYQMKGYSKKLKDHGIFQSMSRKGNCLDNSPMENFFGILKQEMYYGNTYTSFEELKTAIDQFINYYNFERMKSKLDWQSPVTFREHYQQNQAA